MGLLAVATLCQAQPLYPYQNTSLSPEQRAEDLVSRLTLEEKAKLMMDNSPAIERLGIPQFQWWNETLHGIGRNGTATVFPITMGMAASWDDALLQECFTAASDEARAKAQLAKKSGTINRYQSLSFWTPNINIFRDPRWGRGQETYGEDPYLTSRMGISVVRGLQGPDDSKYIKTLACAKHFAVHSGPEWNRHEFNVANLPERDLWETYLPAFKALVQEANVAEVMCAYQANDGEPCCGNNRYLRQILRDEWGFKGLVTSDCWAISDFFTPGRHNFTDSEHKAAALAVRAGTDVECGPHYATLPEAVSKGEITEAEIDESLKRLFVARFRLGDMDPDEMVSWTKIPKSVIASAEHRNLGLQMARETMVLLKNNGVLPLSGKKIALLGPNANDSTMQWGNYNGFPTHTVTFRAGLEKRFDNVKYIPGVGHLSNATDGSRFNELTEPDGRIGIRATYWNNEDQEGRPATMQHYTTALNLSNGGATVFAPRVNLEHFSARYEGILSSEYTETLTLHLEYDDAIRVIVAGDTILNKWDGTEEGKVDLKVDVKAGQKLPIRVDYKQRTGMAMLNFDITTHNIQTEDDIVAQTSDCDVVVFVGGISPRLEGEEMRVNYPGFKGGDRTSIELPQSQRDMLRRLHNMGKKVVFVNCSGGAMALTPEKETCDAILQAWYPGEEGGTALADVLSGDYNPSGKLPITFYRDDSQLPDFLDYKMTGRTYRYMKEDPLFAFGYGLSYTTFEVSKPKYKNNAVTCTVKNTGAKDGTEVVQVYVRRPADKEGPTKTLRAFKRVELKAGESSEVVLDMTREQFECWDETTNTMRVIPGKYELMIGTSSQDKDLQVVKVNIK